MARIRTVKPEMARHEGLFHAEQETKLPIRFVWAMLPTICDRAGRFRWRPNILKLDILPYDAINFDSVLNEFWRRGFIQKYAVDGEIYGLIPTFLKHQCPNNKELKSTLPPPKDGVFLNPEKATLVPDQGQIKGNMEREGEREGEREEQQRREEGISNHGTRGLVTKLIKEVG